ncbi:MAG: hypothetical protein JWL89_691 [Candidatus Saccharibacteria bacterium]|nr:hypothetical protein [Candidatus Saccharibacteria bacterium]
MSGSIPKVGGLGGGAAIAVLPNTGSSRVLFWVAMAALAIGVISTAVSGVMAYRQRSTR